MKKQNHIKNILLGLLCSSFIQVGCTSNFEGWNTNPDEATEEMMERDNLKTGSFFNQMEKNIFVVGQDKGGEYQIIENLAGDIYSGYMANIGVYTYATYNNSHYALYKDWYNEAFDDAYRDIMQPWYKISQETKEKNPSTYALATIVKVIGMSRVTDMYGPIPYTKFGGELEVEYDTQEVVYKSFFDELETSINILTDLYNGDSSAKVMSSYDYVYNGNIEKWIKFANTLRLRLAVRLSYVDLNLAKEQAEKAVNHNLGVMSSTDDAAIIHQNSTFTFKNPIWEISQNFNDIRMGATMDSYLNGYNDPRVAIYFRKASDDSFSGVRNGLIINNKNIFTEGPYSGINFEAGDNMLWMDPSEAYFLRAEGALRGWDMGGTAQSLYEEGIKVSFKSRGASGVEAYLNNDINVPIDYEDPKTANNNINALGNITVKWNDQDNFERKLERIITQKWIAIFPDGQEAWTEFRRTGYPKLFPVVNNKSNGEVSTEKHIRRLKFPTTQYERNVKNVLKALQLLNGPDTGGTNLWWDAK